MLKLVLHGWSKFSSHGCAFGLDEIYMLFSKMNSIPFNTNSLLILLGNSFGYLFIQKVIASRSRSCGNLNTGFRHQT